MTSSGGGPASVHATHLNSAALPAWIKLLRELSIGKTPGPFLGARCDSHELQPTAIPSFDGFSIDRVHLSPTSRSESMTQGSQALGATSNLRTATNELLTACWKRLHLAHPIGRRNQGQDRSEAAAKYLEAALTDDLRRATTDEPRHR